MFWKKKNFENDTIRYNSNDKRETFRYHFKPGRGFTIEFKGKQVMVLNISAGGLAFHNKNFGQFDFDSVQFTLDIPNFQRDSSFSAGLRIVHIDENNICHCLFDQCPLEQHELIHKYVLEMQKNDLTH